MELLHNNQRAYICTLEDYADIESIHLSQPKIHNVKKNKVYNARFPTIMRILLRGLKKDHYVIGCRSTETGKMISYAVILSPEGHSFGFIKFMEAGKNSDYFLASNGILQLTKLAMMIFEDRNQLDFFVVTKLSAAIAAARAKKESMTEDQEGIYNRYNFLLHNIIHPDQKPITPIDKVLVQENPVMPRTKSISIFQVAMKPEYRLQHFKKDLKIKNLESAGELLNNF
jgi:hypothetical protein